VPYFVGVKRIRNLPRIHATGGPGRIFLKEMGFSRMMMGAQKDGN
jgi:hypothetical protein